MERRPTIIDVACRAGVSKSTVSLVLQNSKAVRAPTHKRVLDAMAEIGYVYNRAAANLRSAEAGLIGLVINDLRNPFFTEFATSLQMALSARGYATVIANTDEDPKLQTQVISAMIEHNVSSFIISPAYGDDEGAFDAIARAGIPAMQVLRQVDPRVELFPFAVPDYLAGGQEATKHLLATQARQIAFVGGLEGRGVTEERMAGYLDVLRGAGMSPVLLVGRSSRYFGRDAAKKLAQDYPHVDAAVCFNDLVALGLMAGCYEIGRAVGGTGLRIVGFDDIEESSQCWPSLSSVRCNIAGFGESIAATILAWLEKGIVPPAQTRTAVELVIRGSSTITGVEPPVGPKII